MKLLSTGETKTISQPDALKGRSVFWGIGPWTPDGTRFLASALVDQRYSVWLISLLGDVPRKIRDNARASAISPDGSRIAFRTNSEIQNGASQSSSLIEEIWTMGLDGEQAQRVLSAPSSLVSFYGAQWSPDGKRLAYASLRQIQEENKFEQLIQTRDLKNGSLTTILSIPTLRVFRWLPDGRMIYSATEPDGKSDNLWELRVDPGSGELREQPHKLTNWAGSSLYWFSSTTDGKNLVFLKSTGLGSIYVGDFDQNSFTLKTPQRLTFTEAFDYPMDWTADGKAVIFNSNRTGHWSIYKQSLNQESSEMLVRGAEGAEDYSPKVSPDGSWVVYLEVAKEVWLPGPTRLMRVPIGGGSPELVLSGRFYPGIRCSWTRANLCAFAEQSADRRELIFNAFDPIKGRGQELARMPIKIEPNISYNWDLSWDGKYISAAVSGEESTIHMRRTDGRPTRDLEIKGWPGLNYMDFSAHSNGFFINSLSNGIGTLLYVDQSGKGRPIWQPKSPIANWGTPTRDGRRLALYGETSNSNLWMIKDF